MIVVGGEALVDLVIDQHGGVSATLGGGPFNSARTIGRLGGEVSFLGVLSRDRFGSALAARLHDDGVRDDLLQFTELPTTLAAAELDEQGSASYRFYIADTSAPALSPVSLPASLRVLHVGTLGMVLEPMATVLERCVQQVGHDVLVLLDPNCRPRITLDRLGYLARLQRLLRRADVVKVSTDDLEFMRPGDTGGAVQWLLDGGARVVLHTDGGSSVHVHAGGEVFDVPVPKVTVADTIGAGDSFGGAMAAWWDEAGLGRHDLDRSDLLLAAVAAAVEVAAENCTHVGAEPPWRDELGDRWSPAAQV
jgi:fructokinase